MYYRLDEDVEDSYIRDGVKMLLEEQDDRLEITYADMSPSDTFFLVVKLVGVLAELSGQTHNEVLEDLKITGEK